ncbi:MAG: PASTA domain-containing protein [Marinilabiliaceae bacterium]|nr:PASTA domain-containing protein [Marinilabiliaceae bacterium]
MKNTLLFLISKLFLKHIGIAIGILILFIVSTFIWMRFYTHHGEAFKTPDFTGLTEYQFAQMIEQMNLRYKIIDSVHFINLTPGAVVEQSPKPGNKIKRNRNIFFTINAINPEKVMVPRLTDYSLRNAQVVLESYGLKVGRLIYVPSEYKNLILGQHYKGKAIEPGIPVLKGSTIDLLVGRGLSDEKTNLPNLTGLSVTEASNYLNGISLNLGTIAFDSTVITSEDSAIAFIWKQTPDAKSTVKLQLGSSIDIWVTCDSALIQTDSLLTKNNELDSDSDSFE